MSHPRIALLLLLVAASAPGCAGPSNEPVLAEAPQPPALTDDDRAHIEELVRRLEAARGQDCGNPIIGMGRTLHRYGEEGWNHALSCTQDRGLILSLKTWFPVPYDPDDPAHRYWWMSPERRARFVPPQGSEATHGQ